MFSTIFMYDITMTDGHLKTLLFPKDYYCLRPRAVLEPFPLKGAFILIRSLLQVSLGMSSLNTIFIGDGHNTKWPATALQHSCL